MLARRLVSVLDLPLLSIDTIKEALFDALGTAGGDREYGRALSRASIESIWALVAEFPEDANVMIEGWFGTGSRESVVSGLRRAGVGATAEIWCHARGETLAQRYLDRAPVRHPGHPGPEYVPELLALAARASALALGPTLSVDTTRPSEIDVASVARWASTTLARNP